MPKVVFSRMLGYAGLAAAFAVVGSITVALVVEKMMPPTLRDQLICTAGLTDLATHDCVSDKIASAVDELQAAHDALAGALGGRMIFTEGPSIANVTVITGSIYRDDAARTGLVRSSCWAILDQGGLDPRLAVAEFEPGQGVRAIDVDAFDQAAISVDDRTVAEARAKCPWPATS